MMEAALLHQRWTQTHLTDLRRRTTEGESVATIAGAIQRTPEDVRLMMSRLRLRPATPG